MGVFSIAAYKPREGKQAELFAAVRDHMQVLRDQHLVTDRPAHVMRAEDGTIVEVFEWISEDSIEQAHSNPSVQRLWERFNAACEYVPLVSLPESKELFANFDAIEL